MSNRSPPDDVQRKTTWGSKWEEQLSYYLLKNNSGPQQYKLDPMFSARKRHDSPTLFRYTAGSHSRPNIYSSQISVPGTSTPCTTLQPSFDIQQDHTAGPIYTRLRYQYLVTVRRVQLVHICSRSGRRFVFASHNVGLPTVMPWRWHATQPSEYVSMLSSWHARWEYPPSAVNNHPLLFVGQLTCSMHNNHYTIAVPYCIAVQHVWISYHLNKSAHKST